MASSKLVKRGSTECEGHEFGEAVRLAHNTRQTQAVFLNLSNPAAKSDMTSQDALLGLEARQKQQLVE